MQTIRWTSLLALGMLAVPIAGRAQGPEANATRKLEPATSLDTESAQAGVAGKWYAPASMGPRLTTLEFKVDGAKLTGTVSRYTDSVRIYDGSISGNTISFKYKSPDSFRTISLVGKVSATEIAFTRTVTVDTAGKVGAGGIFGGGGSPTFTATRAVPVFNAPPADLKPTFAGPQPKTTEIATIPGVSPSSIVRMPNGHVLVYITSDSIVAYDLTTKRSTLITRGVNVQLVISPQGDRIAYLHMSDLKGNEMPVIWAIGVDPATGAPTSPAQRVTLSSTISLAFSPDGRSIAFSRIPKDLMSVETGKDSVALAIVPAIGGAERVLTKLGGMPWQVSWSADGKWIYMQLVLNAGPVNSLARVLATGGSPEQVLSYDRPENQKSAIDPRIAFFDPSRPFKGRIGYLTAKGERGEFQVPFSSMATSTNFGPPEIAFSTTIMSRMNILDVATGKVRELPAEGLIARSASWSPDQKRLAFASGEGEHQEIVVMNADGTAQRRVPITGGAKFNGSPTWAPDGKILTYAANDYKEIWALDVATGATRLVTSVAAPNQFQATDVWQADGKSFVATTWTVTNNIPNAVTAVIEVQLNGSKRVLRDLSTVVPSTLSTMVLPHQVVVATGDSPTAGPYGFVLVPLDGGPPRPVPIPALAPGERLGFISGKSENWLAATRTKGNQTAIQLMSTGSDSTRVLPLPANFTPRFPLLFMPDGRHILTYGYTMGEKDFTVYLVPLDGMAPRVIGHLPPVAGTGGIYMRSLSQDGKFYAFFTGGTSTTHVYNVDLTPILNLIKKP